MPSYEYEITNGVNFDSIIVDEGVNLGHAHFACLDKWTVGEFPRCCKCSGHRCNSISCMLPATDKRMVQKLLDQMLIEVWFI